MMGMKRIVAVCLSVCLLICGLEGLGVRAAETEFITIECEDAVLKTELGIATDAASGTVYAYTTGLADDSSAIDTDAEANATYEFEVSQTGEYQLWFHAKSPTNRENSSWISVDGEDYFVFFLKPSAEFTWGRAALLYLKKGKHTLRIKAKRAGQQFDQMLVVGDTAYVPKDEDEDAEKVETSEEADDGLVYMPGNEKLEKDTTVPLFEEKDGSWFIEAEDGLLESPMEVWFDETASDETCVAAKVGSGINKTPEANDPHARYKIYVSKKGQYRLYMRYHATSSTAKSAWLCMDGVNYVEQNSTPAAAYKYYTPGVYNLDVGYHEITFQYRQSGEKIDCFILTDDLNFTPSGLGSLPGEEIRPEQLTYEQRMIPKTYINDTEITSNVDIKKVNGRYMVAVRNLGEYLGVDYLRTGEEVLFSKNRSYMKVTAGSKTAIVNGKKVTMAEAPYFVDDAFVMDLEAFTDAFGVSWSTEDGVRLEIELPDDPSEFEQSPELTIVSTAATELSYTLDLPDENAIVKAYVKIGDKNYWRAGTPLRYGDDNLWHGSFEDLTRQKAGTVKICAITNGEIKYYYKDYDALVWCEYPSVYSLIPHEEGLALRTTFENMSYYLDVEKDGYRCEILYREVGSEEWKKALEPYYDDLNLQFRGSITYLNENTEYEVKAVLSGAEEREVSATAKTWADHVPIAKEIGLSEIYNPDEYEGGLVLENLKGSADGWIKIVPDETCDTVAASREINSVIYVANCEYIIFEGLNVRGGNKNGFSIVNNSHDIRIINCDISDWGRYGVLPEDTHVNEEYDGSTINNDAAIKIMNVGNVVVERCYTHDPHGITNSWKWAHPAGMNPVFVRGRGGVVIRYNDFIGSDAARWNDAIECCGNGTINGGLTMDSDVYGNTLLFGQDDAIEFDDAQINIRFYNNRVEGFLVGVSTIPQMAGPSYVYRNLFTNLGDDRGACNNVMKNGGSYPQWCYGIIYFMNNTAYVACTGINGLAWKNQMPNNLIRMFGRNNILVCGVAPSYYAIKDFAMDPITSYDYDIMATQTGEKVQNSYAEGNELHGIEQNPDFTAILDGQYTLKSGSVGIDQGTVLNNFADNYVGSAPDIGVYEYGSTENKKAVPFKPVDMWADRYQLTLPEGKQTGYVTFYMGDGIPEGTKYKLVVNELVSWITVENEDGETEGIVEPNSEVKVKVNTDSSLKGDVAYANASFMLRLEDGYSVSVTVYGGKY